MANKPPASAWMAMQLAGVLPAVWYAEDLYVYTIETGLYRPVSRQWLQAKVQSFLIELLGSEAISSPYVDDVCRALKNLAFLDDMQKPPFWISKSQEANVIVTSNSVVLLDEFTLTGTMATTDHTPDLFALCGVPYPFDPRASCPRWIEFTSWMVGGNQDEVRLLQQYCAWVFIARLLRLERILWLCGPGGNGKSTWLKIVRYVIGESATSAVGLDAFGGGENFRLWPTLYKRANFSTDSVVKKTSNVAALNSYVSGDPFTINRKFREQLTVEPATVTFFASNPLPLYADASDAFWRRLFLIICRQRVAEDRINPRLLEELKEEAPGILNWMLEPIPHLLAQKRFDIPESVRENVDALKAEVNAARQFLREKVQAGDQQKDWIARDQLMAIFGAWCDSNGYRRESLAVMKQEIRSGFNSEMTRRRKGTITPGERVYGWLGLKWKPEETDMAIRPANLQVELVFKLVEEKEKEIAMLRKQIRSQVDNPRTEPEPLPQYSSDGEADSEAGAEEPQSDGSSEGVVAQLVAKMRVKEA